MSRFTKDILQGITIAIKGASRKYPFIVGWELPKNANDYEFTTYVNLLVSPNKLKDYFNKELKKSFYSNESGSLSSFFETPDPWEQKEEWDKVFNFFYEKKKEIQNYITMYYDAVPDEYSLFVGRGLVSKKPEINIDNFIISEKNPN